MAQPISNLGTIPTLSVGGRVFTDLTTLIVLAGGNLTINRYSTLRKPNGTAGYQVTVGKTLRIDACRIWTTSTGGLCNVGLLYGDTDVGLDSASAPTTAVSYGGSSSVYVGFQGTAASGVESQAPAEITPFFSVVAQKYAAMLSDRAATNMTAFGYET